MASTKRTGQLAGKKRTLKFRSPALWATAGAALAVFGAPGASAQTPSPLGEWQYSAGVPLEKMFVPPAERTTWETRVGAGMTFEPRYDGSSRYHILAGPSLDIRYKDLAFLSTGEGLGVNVLQGENWRTSVALVYDLGRRGHDDPQHLNGLGNINPAPEIKLAAEYVISKDFPLTFRTAITRSIGGSNGWIADVGAYMPLPGSSESFYWFAGPSVSFADSTYMNSWFGVNPAQSAASGLRQYDASAGLKSAGFGVTMIWFVNKHWFVTADGAIKRLLGSAAGSPVIQTKTNGVCDISLNYQF
ncbi:outer membrane scaffolding protein for murein synthesis (MipA/OmpV family) [Paraburkholderia rhizosphaerae]|uniref:Outer membrane scaffolding protein for murein synthesis (MipA/OmpV family) n=1 Tax=Paraburkholderia rhizosphaerae TaxID=480658 RepID=A0A4R8L8S3_9BURK|nr:outer membrane scaffolding protein for murein synthesis (MipA/OmpV family) [Paraburkholderia rhizosphaerae]